MVNVESIVDYVNKNYSFFGVTKRQEMSRLLFEIAKKESIDFVDICRQIPQEAKKFSDLKQYLVKRRFPQTVFFNENRSFNFSKIDIESENKLALKNQFEIKPKLFVIEEAVKDSALVNRLREKYSQAEFEITLRYKEYVGKKPFTLKDYNNRLDTFYVIKENFDFYKRCPCSCKSVSCGYHVINLGSGCGFECTYCFLQGYINYPGIVLPANIEDFFESFQNYKQDIRLGSGEYTDSLIFDYMTEFSLKIVEFFKKYPKSTFEFKTKSTNIDNLLKIVPAGNIVVSWTLNPQNIVETTEFYTASLQDRLEAAQKCAQAGYKIAFHYDPIIYYEDWEKDYYQCVNQMFDIVDPEFIDWISLGTLRMTPKLKKAIENRFPENKILDGELLQGYDGKFRYPLRMRADIYNKMKEWIFNRDKNAKIYLCMEENEAYGMCDTLPFTRIIEKEG